MLLTLPYLLLAVPLGILAALLIAAAYLLQAGRVLALALLARLRRRGSWR